jgi:hypothetical protein
MYTRDFNFELYAKTTRERDLWVESFCRAIETKHSSAFTNWSEDSKKWLETKNEWEARKSRYSQVLTIIRTQVDGLDEFKSANMFYNCVQVEGWVMKKINNKKVYHVKPFHKKWMRLVYVAESI